MAAWGYEFYLRVLKVSLSALEDKIRIPKRPCNILYFLHSCEYYSETCLETLSCQSVDNTENGYKLGSVEERNMINH